MAAAGAAVMRAGAVAAAAPARVVRAAAVMMIFCRIFMTAR